MIWILYHRKYIYNNRVIVHQMIHPSECANKKYKVFSYDDGVIKIRVLGQH
jgi:hypothetical protein